MASETAGSFDILVVAKEENKKRGNVTIGGLTR